ncbi:MAG: thermonuclease family protein, partial [Actinomycetota bacterium]|nr:thermonuclease family protein [Actinomycetota bacterium]
ARHRADARRRRRRAAPDGVPAGAQPARVLEVVDGDTIEVRAERAGPLPAGSPRTVRLLEIDTPETVHPSVGTECYGPQASAFATRRLPAGSRVWLVADEDRRDRYGRDLRYVWTDEGDFFNLQAVRLGFAEAVLYEPNDAYIRRMRAAEAAARAAERGLWAACTGGAPNPPALAPPPSRRSPGRGCEPGYRGACVPAYPPDVDCGQIPDTGFASVGADPHGLDDDDDGVACEG